MLLPYLALASIAVPGIQAALQYRAMDWSSLLIEEERNGVYYQNVQGVVQPLEQILTENGVNMVRQCLDW